MRVLVVVWDGAGSFTPERSLVRALVGRGHGVHVLGHDSLRDEVAEDGAHFEPLRSAPQYDSTTEMTPEEEFSFCFDGIWLSKGYAADTSAAIDRIKPDVVLVDAALAYAMAAALASGLPTVALWGTLYGLFAAGPYQQVLDSRMAEVNAYSAERGLAPAASYRAFLESAPLVLICGFRQFGTVEDLPRPVRHVGPLRAPTSEVERWQRRRPRAPLVLVSLSTGYQAQAELPRKLGEALGGLEIEAIVTTGPAVSPDAVPAAGNTCVVRFVSHDAVLPQADLLISHAGHGTVMAGIVHGVPMLCLPMGRDQPAVAGRVVELGLGRLLDPRASVAEIRDAVAAALADRRIGETAVAFAASLAEHPGVEDAIVAIEDLIPDSAAERSA